MEIENNSLPAASAQSAAAAPQRNQVEQSTADDKASAAPSSDDRVSLTATAQQLQSLEAQIAEQPVVDSQRVQAAREAINSGTFEVRPEQIASKLVGIEQALTDAR